MPKQKILFIGGSLNMTRMVHEVSRHLCDEYECYFTPYYADHLYRWVAEHTRLVDFTVLGGNFMRQTVDYFNRHQLPLDPRGEGHDYDLVVTTSDLYVPVNIRDKPFILVQEGMTDPENLFYHLVKYLKLPRYFASTSTFGLSDQYRYLCVASEGYRDFFARKGIKREKLVVTGIPNFDNCASYLDNDFPYHNFVLVATSDARETYKVDNRSKFIRKAIEIADGRQLIFKLHPNENFKRATREILDQAPDALIYTDGNIDHMIANCEVLICQYSTVVYVGLALGKEVHSYFDIEMLKEMVPLQNGGTSGQNIAQVCRHMLRGEPVNTEEFLNYAGS